MARLFLLLPRSYHSSILLESCRDSAGDNSIEGDLGDSIHSDTIHRDAPSATIIRDTSSEAASQIASGDARRHTWREDGPASEDTSIEATRAANAAQVQLATTIPVMPVTYAFSSSGSLTYPSTQGQQAQSASADLHAAAGPDASLAFQMIAAAAPLAQGDLDTAWDPHWLEHFAPEGRVAYIDRLELRRDNYNATHAHHSDAHRGNAVSRILRRMSRVFLCNCKVPPEESSQISEEFSDALVLSAHSVSEQALVGLRGAAPVVTKLTVVLQDPGCHPGGFPWTDHTGDNDRPHALMCDIEQMRCPGTESARWCVALAQLRTLRILRIHASEPCELHPDALGPALHGLPALRELALRCHKDKTANSATFDASSELLWYLCQLTQISALELHHCFHVGWLHFHTFESSKQPSLPDPGVPQLARLSQLTSLALTAYTGEDQEESPEVDHAVKSLVNLRHLHMVLSPVPTEISVDSPSQRGPASVALCKAAVNVCTLPELTALQSVSIPGGFGLQPILFERFMRSSMPNFSQPWHTQLAPRLTQLDLSGNKLGQGRDQEAGLFELMLLLSGATALRELNISHMPFGDNGVMRIAEADWLRRLTWLSVSAVRAQQLGVFALLHALIDLQSAELLALKYLDVSGNFVEEDQWGELERLVGRLEGVTVHSWQARPPTKEESTSPIPLHHHFCKIFLFLDILPGTFVPSGPVQTNFCISRALLCTL